MKLERPDLRPEPGFIFKVIFVALVVALIAAIYTISSIFILTFGAIIVAAALTNLSHPIERRLHIPHRVALAIGSGHLGLGPAQGCHPLLAEHAVPHRANQPAHDPRRGDSDKIYCRHDCSPFLPGAVLAAD